jgi:hypothetical protein
MNSDLPTDQYVKRLFKWDTIFEVEHLFDESVIPTQILTVIPIKRKRGYLPKNLLSAGLTLVENSSQRVKADLCAICE